jgi:hypothetical protein
MGDALTPHSTEIAVTPAPPPTVSKRRSLWSLWGVQDWILDGLTRAANGLIHRLASLLGALIFPSRSVDRAQLRRLAAEIRARTARFDDVRALADPDIVAPSLRATLRQQVHAYERRLVRVEYRSEACSGIPTVALALALLIYAVFVFFDEDAIARVLRAPISLKTMTSGVLFLVVHIFAVSFFLQLPSELMRMRRERGFSSGFAYAICAIMPAILGIPCLAAVYVTNPLPVRLLLLAIGQAGLLYVIFLAFFFPLVVFRETRKATAPRRAHPDAFVAHQLILALLVLEDGQGDVRDRTKLILLGLLDSAARSMQDVPPSMYRSSDLAMDVWLTDSARQWAAALSDLKKWVITPKHDTREHLTRHLAAQFAYFVGGRWDGLARREPEAVSRRRVGRALITEAARVIAAAGVPVLGFVLLQRSPWALTGAAAATATLTVAAFGLVAILSAFVPDLDMYIATTKSVLNLVTFGKKD